MSRPFDRRRRAAGGPGLGLSTGLGLLPAYLQVLAGPDADMQSMPDLDPRILLVALGSLFSACSSDGDDGMQDIVDPNVQELRDVLAAQGIAAVPGPPPVSDELFALGQALFFDKVLSGNEDVSCSTCHLPGVASVDGRTLPGGVGGTGLGTGRSGGEVIPRNSPSILNAHLLTSVFWDGRVERLMNGDLRVPTGTLPAAIEDAFAPGLEVLAAQALFPPTSPAEMRGNPGDNPIANLTSESDIWEALTTRVLSYTGYQNMVADAYPALLLADVNFGHLANAIASFEAAAFAATDSPLAAFLGGDDGALTAAQLRGGLEFFGQALCSDCHEGSTFGGRGFQNIGMAQFGPGKGDGGMGTDDFGREQVTGIGSHRYQFRAPMLLNVELTAPFGHTGQYSTLVSQVDHYRDATDRLNTYDISEHVDDPALIGTQEANQMAVIDRLDPRVRNPIQFDVEDMTDFLRALTAASALDLSGVVPTSVPSGSTIDS